MGPVPTRSEILITPHIQSDANALNGIYGKHLSNNNDRCGHLTKPTLIMPHSKRASAHKVRKLETPVHPMGCSQTTGKASVQTDGLVHKIGIVSSRLVAFLALQAQVNWQMVIDNRFQQLIE